MSDKFYTQKIFNLTYEILEQFESSQEVLGLPKTQFFNPQNFPSLKVKRYGQLIATPFGVAAGPHTQLARNIIAAWTMGARYIELKTIQTLDEIEVKKPCIDMQDEGYNCEWSQELKIKDSFNEYLNAWIIIHILNHKMGWGNKPETIFNMSVGYDLAGIMNNNVQWFFEKMANCSKDLAEKIILIKELYPSVEGINIPSEISNNITLSTMHGCPPKEIEEISRYLISEKHLHTTIKLNPTLLGQEKLNAILKDTLNYPIEVPQEAFEHDIKYNDALNIIKNLWSLSKEKDLHFAIKLTNTLEVKNNRKVLPEEMNYMSGRALHPISVNLAYQIQKEFNGDLDISFSGGADAFNISDLVKSGLSPITVSSDLLKPGGYGRLIQYYTQLSENNVETSLINEQNVQNSQLEYLKNYAQKTLEIPTYKYELFHSKNIKSERILNTFDCIAAPCMDACPTEQDIPDYLYWASQGNFNKALDVIYQKNPFPHTLGLICEHSCQAKCTRINYDQSLRIRDIKEFIAINGKASEINPKPLNGIKIAIIGAGPSGLSAAWFLALEGCEIDIFEKNTQAGGLPQSIIPDFRLNQESLKKDINRILDLGVNIHYNSEINKSKLEKITQDYSYIYFAAGAEKSKQLNIQGNNKSIILDPLEFLRKHKSGEKQNLGMHILIIGAGNTAMDVARTAKKLQKENGTVSIVYRRTMAQMPAQSQEITDVLNEGITIKELLAPVEIIKTNGNFELKAQKMTLSHEIGADGRQIPKILLDEYEYIKSDCIIPALGQESSLISKNFNPIQNLQYANPDIKLYTGGDANRGASSIVQAVADGRIFAEHILQLENLNRQTIDKSLIKKKNVSEHLEERSLRIESFYPNNSSDITTSQAIEESSRCLQCDEYCNICISVCPNRANQHYQTEIQTYKIQNIEISGHRFKLRPAHHFSITQESQIYNIGDYCNECGNCSTFCPTSGAPYLVKPQIHLSRASFDNASRGFYYNENVMLGKSEDGISKFKSEAGKLIYENNKVEIVMAEESLKVLDVFIKEEGEYLVEIDEILEMKILMESLFSNK